VNKFYKSLGTRRVTFSPKLRTHKYQTTSYKTESSSRPGFVHPCVTKRYTVPPRSLWNESETEKDMIFVTCKNSESLQVKFTQNNSKTTITSRRVTHNQTIPEFRRLVATSHHRCPSPLRVFFDNYNSTNATYAFIHQLQQRTCAHKTSQSNRQ
jgi:hypothetical protein